MFILQVEDVNDRAPEFLPTSDYTFSFTELKPADTYVATINTTDGDSQGPNTQVNITSCKTQTTAVVPLGCQALRVTKIMLYDITLWPASIPPASLGTR